MPVAPEALAEMTRKYALDTLPRDLLIALWNACSKEFIRREKLAVKDFEIGDAVGFRLMKGGTRYGVVLKRHVRTLTIGVKTSEAVFKYHVSPFNANRLPEDGPAAKSVRRQ